VIHPNHVCEHGFNVPVVTQPEAYFVGRAEVVQGELERFLADHGVSWETDAESGAEVLVEAGGRLCYLSYVKPRPGGNQAYIERIIQQRHGSVLEHSLFTWILVGLSRDTTHELVRYRHFSFSQLSGRYVDSTELGFVVPTVIRQREKLYTRWLQAVELCRAVYTEIDQALLAEFTQDHLNTLHPPDQAIPFPPEGVKLDPETKRNLQKRSREAARSVLPGACETKIKVSGNARAMRHFFEERCNKHAAWEIRRVACKMFEQAEGESPDLFQGYETENLPDGNFHLHTTNPKV
jgi:thymidylate synthase (FAD)